MKCKNCKATFIPISSLQNWCSPDCGYQLSLAAKARLQKKKDIARKEELRPLSFYIKKAQTAFNAYIRARDADLPCISCGSKNDRVDAGHYRTSKAAPWLRFNEYNVNAQCAMNCNVKLSGNILEYRKGLIKKYGIEIVESLENSDSKVGEKSYTKEHLLEIELIYKNKLKQIKSSG